MEDYLSGEAQTSITISPAGTFAYVTNTGDVSSDGSISVYHIDTTTGALTPVNGSLFKTGSYPASITINPAGTFAYVVTLGHDTGRSGSIKGGISAYRIDTTTGSLTPVHGSPFKTGNYPTSITVNPAGTFAYVAHMGEGSISVYRINPATGALKPVRGSPFANAMNSVYSIVFNPAGTFVYMSATDDAGFSTIKVYQANAETGALTQIHGSPFVVTNSSPITIAR